MTAVVLSVPRFDYFADKLAEYGHFERGEITETPFPNGELKREIVTKDLRGKDVLVVGSTDDQDFLSLFSFANQAARDARSVNIVLPFYRYATMERRNGNDGAIISAKDRATIMSAIARASQGNNVMMFDLHAEAIEHYFNSASITARPVRCEPLIAESIRSMIQGDIVIGSADSGRHDWITSLAKTLGVDFALLNKKRLSGTETIILGDVIGNVEGKTVVMYDDMIRTGGTAISAAEKYLEAGAKKVWLVATHPDFAPGALQRIKDSGKIEGVITTNSYPTFLGLMADFQNYYRVVELEALAAEALHRLGIGSS